MERYYLTNRNKTKPIIICILINNNIYEEKEKKLKEKKTILTKVTVSKPCPVHAAIYTNLIVFKMDTQFAFITQRTNNIRYESEYKKSFQSIYITHAHNWPPILERNTPHTSSHVN